MTDGVVLYPSGWYYNACVMGFMEVLEYGLGEDRVRHFYQKDGTIQLPPQVVETIYSTPQEKPAADICAEAESPLANLKRLAWWWVEKSKPARIDTHDAETIIIETCKSLLGSNKTFYPGLFAHNTQGSRIEFLNNWFSLNCDHVLQGNMTYHCSFCGAKYSPDFSGRDYDSFFSNTISKFMGTSLGSFPNAFWGKVPDLVFCKTCRAILLFFHISYKAGMFINAHSFQQMEHLNRIMDNQQDFNSKYYYKNHFLIKLLHRTEQMKQTLGAWQRQGLALVLFSNTGVEEIYLPVEVTGVLFHPSVAGWLRKLHGKEDKELLLFLARGEYARLLGAIYQSVRLLVQSEQVMTEYQPCAHLIHLYQAINCQINKGRRQTMQIDAVMNLKSGDYPEFLTDQGAKLRLLEMVRLGQRQDIQYFLIRAYVAEKKSVPETISQALNLENINEFKSVMFAFIAGLPNKPKTSEEKGNVK
ncbi:hypothetical protein SOV_42880 [Sporomusa ovata DSM 2662]|uniref:Uncharacterized protein aq_372 n=1 Tax=Sporomusa ovata TaxID=2378 RepID=A0A0U1KTK7_9FIRM|nr:type I-B CRISPR-associated protein Cas8b1/Cst1 [Sporomusa ovata]EQB26676.1 CRISPR-associated protein Cas8a1/Cst1, subtype I-B/TNEAP [Sporomusa ovata DSM 2662]CQR70770.1 Uncharacterized protein aq_372 [Sporomusa ovata]